MKVKPEAYLWLKMVMTPAPSEVLLSSSKELPVPMEALRGDSVVEEESAEPAVSLEQLKNGRSYGKMLLKSGYMKLEGAESLTQERMAKTDRAMEAI